MDERDTCNIAVPLDTPDENRLRNWEYPYHTDASRVKDSLKSNYTFWENILKPSSFVSNVIRFGYILQFHHPSPPFTARNNQSSILNAEFVDSAVSKLLSDGLIRQVESVPYCCNPLTVAHSAGKYRLVLDLRHVNQYVKLKKFRYENLKILAMLLERGDFFINYDLKSGYHHLNIHPASQKYLGFQWTFADGKSEYFEFTVLPFGLNVACYVFTKILRPVVKYWRDAGIKMVTYLDDGLGAQPTKSLAESATKLIFNTLISAGFCINHEKSNFTPVQRGKWLGTLINTVNMEFSVPTEKIENLKTCIRTIIRIGKSSARDLAQVTGQLASMYLSLGSIASLFTRHLYSEIAQHGTWDTRIEYSQEVEWELKFWLRNIEKYNGSSFAPRPSNSMMIFSDASGSGYGGFLVHKLGRHICAGRFTTDEACTSSTYRELLAVEYVLKSYSNLLKNQNIQILSDNMSATRIIAVGSKKLHLHHIALNIFEHCQKFNIALSPQWIPREQNHDADFYSKMKDTDSWSIDNESFNFIQQRFGPFHVDRFADNLNAKLPRFNSKFYCPRTSHVNAFTAHWGGVNNWICPPISCIPEVLQHLHTCKAYGTLVIPHWPSAYWWPLVRPGGKIDHNLCDSLTLDPYYQSYTSDSLFNGFQQFHTLALQLDFRNVID